MACVSLLPVEEFTCTRLPQSNISYDLDVIFARLLISVGFTTPERCLGEIARCRPTISDDFIEMGGILGYRGELRLSVVIYSLLVLLLRRLSLAKPDSHLPV